MQFQLDQLPYDFNNFERKLSESYIKGQFAV
jgi:hypothetical protein